MNAARQPQCMSSSEYIIPRLLSSRSITCFSSKAPASVKAKVKKNKVTVSWKKIKSDKKGKKLLKQISGIQVMYSTDPNFKLDVKTKRVGKRKTKVVLKLKNNKIYYIRVRYVGKDGYSKWSTRKVKTK